MSYFSIHNHTDSSNFRLRDSINKVEKLIDYAFEIGLSGLVITEHEALSSHVKAHKYMQKNKEKFGEFTVSYGNEIYLVDETETEVSRGNNEYIPFYHFILIAKNQNGYAALKKLSSQAWKNSFMYKGIERVPTYKSYLEQIMKEYKGDLIASTACIGGEIPKLLIQYKLNPTSENKRKVHEVITWLKDLFGDDFYLELQPSHNDEQTIANEMLLKIGTAYGIKCIVSTDAHYLKKSQAKAHEIYLTASEGDREVAEFYATTYVMSYNELLHFFDRKVLDELVANTLEIKAKIKPIEFEQIIKVPKASIPFFALNPLFQPYYNSYEYIKKYSESKYAEDRYYLHLIANGMIEKDEQLNEENLSRINLELDELYHISENLNQPMAAYFINTKENIDIMWEVSLVGVSRGSASCFYLNYLLDIVQINPIKYNLPHWRFISKERPTLPDIDIDTESARRLEIVAKTKEHYGEENVLNMGTFITEGTKSTVLTVCRGLGVDNDISQNLSNMVPMEKNDAWSLKDIYEGNEEKGRKPATNFINEIQKLEDSDENFRGLKETMFAIEGLISGRSQHASGLIIFPNGYLAQNAMMKTTSGLPVTQFDADDSEFQGGLKYDYLSINALDRIRAAMELLLYYKKIDWQGSIRATYNKYFHPDVLEMESPEMFDLLFKGEILSAFQYETNVGKQALLKIQPRTFDELCDGNALMRLSVKDGEQPIDKYVRFKQNINDWFAEMDAAGLTPEEQEPLKKLLINSYGICATQEGLMILSMEPTVAAFNLTEANNFRKAVAKKDEKKLKKVEELFFKKGAENGTRKEVLDYAWNVLLKPQFGYSFSLPHIAGYTLILMIEMNICYKYGSIFWKTACLSVNAGLVGEDAKNTNYGAIAKAIGDMKDDVYSPDINKSDLGFTPLEKEGKILFGLKPISGLGTDNIDVIINNRPYKDFDDFYHRIVETNLLTINKTITLIKAGCFDEFNPDRRNLMIEFVKKITPLRDKLTMANLPTIIEFVDKKKYGTELELYEFRNKIQGKNKIEMNPDLEREFIQKYSKDVAFKFENGKLIIDMKNFEKFYKKSIENLKNWVTSSDAAEQFTKIKMQQFWRENCSGNVEQWEMETILFYTDKHELDYMPLNDYFKISSFNELPLEPEILQWKVSKKGFEYPIFKIENIAGTVVDKNKNKSLVYILTQDSGVVTLKYQKGQFAYYDKKIVQVDGKDKDILDDSWFARGSKLVVSGYRRGEEFVVKAPYKKHSTYKINGYYKGKLYFQNEKVEG